MKSLIIPVIATGMTLVIAGCSTPTPTPDATASNSSTPAPTVSKPVVSKPLAKDGKDIAQLTVADVSIDPDFKTTMQTDDATAKEAATVGVDALKAFTVDFGKYQTINNTLDQKQLLALLPEAEAKMKPLLSPELLADFSKQWKDGAADPNNLVGNPLLLIGKLKDPKPEDNFWKNKENLKCEISDKQMTVAAENPRIVATTMKDVAYPVTSFITKAHYYIPCADGKIMQQDTEWELTLGPSQDGNGWRVYQWNRKLTSPATFVK